jgi:hypothetical protein
MKLGLQKRVPVDEAGRGGIDLARAVGVAHRSL